MCYIDAEDFRCQTALLRNRVRYPNSKGLKLLENKLYPNIGLEGLIDSIRYRYNRFIDKIVVKLNRFIGVFKRFSEEEKSILSAIDRGELSAREVTLPVSFAGVGKFLKFIAAIIGWFTLRSATGYVAARCRAQRESDERDLQEHLLIKDKLDVCEKVLADRDAFISRKEAAQKRGYVYNQLANAAETLKNKVKHINYEEIEKNAEILRERQAKTNGMTEDEFSKRSTVRTIALASVLAGWVSLTVWILKRVYGFFKHIFNGFKGSTIEESKRLNKETSKPANNYLDDFDIDFD